jgi:hypothetical protein
MLNLSLEEQKNNYCYTLAMVATIAVTIINLITCLTPCNRRPLEKITAA